MNDRRLTPHGELLDRARVALGITQREAARRSGISEGRWRQIITGVQRQGGMSIPVNPKASTLAAMSRAVDADRSAVLAAAGLSESDLADEPARPPDRIAELEERLRLSEAQHRLSEERMRAMEEKFAEFYRERDPDPDPDEDKNSQNRRAEG